MKDNFSTAAMRQIQVLVIGDIMLDRYLRGEVNRKSPEADVDVLDHKETTSKIGGAGNVALNFQSLGVRTRLLSVTGKDEAAYELEHLLSEKHIHHILLKDVSRPTTVKTRLIAEDQHLLRVDFENTDGLNQEVESLVIETIEQEVINARPNIIVLQDYNKGVLTPNVIRNAIEIAKRENIYIAVDPKKDHFWLYKNVDLFKPNLRETEEAIGGSYRSLEKWTQAAKILGDRLNAGVIAITLSENGILLLDVAECIHIPTEEVEIVDVCGAGDAVLAILSLMHYLGKALKECGEWANKVGAQVCQTSGVSVVRTDEL